MSALAPQPVLVHDYFDMAANKQQYPLSPTEQSIGYNTTFQPTNGGTAILLRNLPQHTSREELKTMLLFAKDLQDAELIPPDPDQNRNLLSAVARFRTAAAASEAQAMLNGKKNTAGQAIMVVETITLPAAFSSLHRRNTVDNSISRSVSHSISPSITSQPSRQSSRYGGTFQSMERISPPSLEPPSARDSASTDANPLLRPLFSPQLPLTNVIQDRSRVSGKSVINQDGHDHDTGELLKDPVAYMNNDQPKRMPPLLRRSTNPHFSPAGFAALSLNTNMVSPTAPAYPSPRSNLNLHSPNSARSPSMGAMTPNMAYQANQQYPRHNYPPVNPADQNPPCNTLYVGNLPIDTSEDELKAMFSKQRGYKRLCFRTKQNGPMCFVEFEDVSFATKALNELYGVQLHNSVKGGIRLSFSKNPLGVRTGQQGSVGSVTPLASPGPLPTSAGLGPISPGGTLTAQGPPPGLTVPPGLGMPAPMTPSLMNAGFPDRYVVNSATGQPLGPSPGSPGLSTMYPDYMMGR